MLISNLFHPQLEKIRTLFEQESNSFRKVHRMIDLFEAIIKTHTAVIVADYFRYGNLSDNIKGLLTVGLRVPTLGVWQYFSRELLKEMQAKGLEPFIDGFYEYFQIWDKKYVNKVLSFRNKYAHGATPDDGECEEDIKKHLPILEEWLTVKWLYETEMLIRERRVYLRKLTGSPQREELDLFPIMRVKEVERNGVKNREIIFFNDMKIKKTINYLHYPYALHIKDREIWEEFQRKIKTEEWKREVRAEFRERIEELTDIFEGREEEKDFLKEWIRTHDKGFLLIYGKPGIGKSAFIAEVFKELRKQNKRNNQYVLIEYFIRRGTRYAKATKMLRHLNQRLKEAFNTKINLGQNEEELQDNLTNQLHQISSKEEKKKVVLFIDGLDEGEEANITSYLINEAYKNVVIIYGSRMTKEVETFYNRLPIEYK